MTDLILKEYLNMNEQYKTSEISKTMKNLEKKLNVDLTKYRICTSFWYIFLPIIQIISGAIYCHAFYYVYIYRYM